MCIRDSSYRTISPLPPAAGGDRRRYVSVALSVGSRRPGVTWHPARWSPDFPLPARDGERLPGLRAANPLAPAARLEAFLGANGVPALNLTWALRAVANQGERLYYVGDGHFNPRGHAVAADRLALWLRETRLAP